MKSEAARLPSADAFDPGALVTWYEENARVLPWRVGPAARRRGARPDPYAVWISEIMLQQTTAATVRARFEDFVARWPTVEALAAASLDDVLGAWAGLGYYARARNLHACAREIAREAGGVFPDAEEGLRALPGIGEYTAAAIAAIAFDRRAVVVDGNVERIVSRLFRIEKPLPAAKREIRRAAAEIWPQARSGDFAQALMDLGAAICRPKAPACLLCPVSSACAAFAAGDAETYPRKAAKRAKPQRRGAAFALFNAEGEFLLERRPAEGLLGGMLALPSTEWTENAPTTEDRAAAAPAPADWSNAGAIDHVFTHFRLTLDVYIGRAKKGFKLKAGQKWARLASARVPTVMRKAIERALGGDDEL